ncbi:hypothetical protein SLS62_009823 [Diatrype stigma]|uniref:FAD-binding domain-containing protein n=1 Tax=Diatrype stigma TaxID=117547 RepID=A0AAN9UF38_9PEZI
MKNDATSPIISLGEFKDGVQRYPLTGIKVLIVGAGIGGLLAALECYRKGHSVLVLERAPSLSTVGDVFATHPPGFSTLKYYPALLRDYQAGSHDTQISFYTRQGQFVAASEPEWRDTACEREAGGRIGVTIPRPAHAAMLMGQIERLGIPVLFGRRVVRYTEDRQAGIAAAHTDGGECFDADVIIAADGIHSAAHDLLKKGSYPPYQPTNSYAARAGFPRELLAPGPQLQSILPKPGERDVTRVYCSKDVHLFLDATQTYVSFCYVYKDTPKPSQNTCQLSENTRHKYEHPMALTPAELLAIMTKDPDWDPAILELVSQAPREIMQWSLNFRNPHRQWTSPGGHVVMIGDAAHTFLPTSGNGAVQASEDAVSIAECLRQGGRENIAWSTRVHNTLRYERVSTIQRTGFVNQDILDSVDQVSQHPDAVILKIGSWMWGHLPEKYAADNYRDALAALRSGVPFENTNLPPGYKFREWTMEEEQERQSKGIVSDLRSNGDWTA